MEDLTNIWNADDELNEEQLMNYVKGKSAGEEEHEGRASRCRCVSRFR